VTGEKKIEGRKSRVERGQSFHSSSLAARLKAVRLFLCDVDGVLTDGSVYLGGAREIKRFNIRDGLGLIFLRRAGFKVGWVSARPSPVTEARAAELAIDFLVQQGDRLSKTGAVEKLLRRTRLDWDAVCFVGDDVVDLGPLTRAGLAVAVADARPEVKASAHYVTRAAGGHGAVRETAEMILQAQNKWHAIIAHYQE
jgi:3-deoxy-D-manno-octulosonate 8-phosphate phosphatase (KDO 8-P phosphatase)